MATVPEISSRRPPTFQLKKQREAWQHADVSEEADVQFG